MTDSALIDMLSDDRTDERAGREAIRGFSFQVWWATCEALELLKTKDDFVVVLEYKQDVAILDSPSQPTSLAFYQIKKNEGVTSAPWSVNELLAQDANAKKGPTSILGKLFQHRPRFKKTPVTLEFVANTGFSYGTPKLEYESVELAQLPDEVATKVRQAIAADLNVKQETVDLTGSRLTRTHVPLEQTQRWACGILDEVEAAAVLPFAVRNKGATAQILAGEFFARAGKRAFAKDFAALLERGMTKAQLVALLMQHSSVVRRSSKTEADEICTRLSHETYPWRLIDSMKNQMAKVCVDLTNRNHPTIGQLARLAMLGRQACLNEMSNTPLGTDIDAVVSWLFLNHEKEVSAYEKGYLYLVVALTIKDAHELKLLAAAAD